MATATPIIFGPGDTQNPRGATQTQRRAGIDNAPLFPGEPFPYGLARIAVPVAWTATGRARIVCNGVCQIATVGTSGDTGSIGATIDIPVGVEIEVNLEGGAFVFGLLGVVELRGLLLIPAIGAEAFVVGEPT